MVDPAGPSDRAGNPVLSSPSLLRGAGPVSARAAGPGRRAGRRTGTLGLVERGLVQWRGALFPGDQCRRSFARQPTPGALWRDRYRYQPERPEQGARGTVRRPQAGTDGCRPVRALFRGAGRWTLQDYPEPGGTSMLRPAQRAGTGEGANVRHGRHFLSELVDLFPSLASPRDPQPP